MTLQTKGEQMESKEGILKGFDPMRAMQVLYELLAEQEGVESDYTITYEGKTLTGTTAHRKVSDLSHKGKKEA